MARLRTLYTEIHRHIFPKRTRSTKGRTMSEDTDPRVLAQELEGQVVTATLTNQHHVTGVLMGSGSHGLTIASGIGGHRPIEYGHIDDLVPVE